MAKKPRLNKKPKASDTDYQIDRYYQMYYGSDSGEEPQPSKAARSAAKAEEKRMTRMRNDYLNQGSGRVSKGKVKAKYAKGVKSPGRAQPPRTGPGSGAGGGAGARYTRLTGGGGPRSHGR
jgi:hypothetical protein